MASYQVKYLPFPREGIRKILSHFIQTRWKDIKFMLQLDKMETAWLERGLTKAKLRNGQIVEAFQLTKDEFKIIQDNYELPF